MLALQAWKYAAYNEFPFSSSKNGGPYFRVSSPAEFSILITLAPRSPTVYSAQRQAKIRANSNTFMFLSADSTIRKMPVNLFVTGPRLRHEHHVYLHRY